MNISVRVILILGIILLIMTSLVSCISGQAEKAIAIRLNPNDAFAYYKRGEVRNEIDDKKGAIADYTEAIRVDSNYSHAYCSRGKARIALGDKQGRDADIRIGDTLFLYGGNQSGCNDVSN
jgi:tetratricopeptide (TPR) repeat protein